MAVLILEAAPNPSRGRNARDLAPLGFVLGQQRRSFIDEVGIIGPIDIAHCILKWQGQGRVKERRAS